MMASEGGRPSRSFTASMCAGSAARIAVESVLPAVKYLAGFQFYIPEKGYQKDSFWIDDFKIGRDVNEK